MRFAAKWWGPDEHVGDGVLITVAGEVDGRTAPLVRDVAVEAVRESRCTHLVIDAEQVAFFDSNAVGVLMELVRAARARGGEVVLRRPSPTVLRVLEIAGVLELVRREDAAPEPG